MIGRIIRIVSNQYTIVNEKKERLSAIAMGKMRLEKRMVVGDVVEYQLFEEKYGIQKVLERKNSLIRPAIANVDQAMIVMSAVDPDFSSTLVDCLIFLISYHDIEPVIVISKMDLVGPDHAVYRYIKDYQDSGYQVVLIGKELDSSALQAALKGKVTVLAGQSGVGKSSLINRLNPAFMLHTQETSKALGRGKHTTRHTELFEVCDGYVADTPGFSSLDFSRIDERLLASKVKDFQLEQSCRFNDCRHINEPDCAIKKAVETGQVSKIRYQNFLEIAPYCNVRKEWEK